MRFPRGVMTVYLARKRRSFSMDLGFTSHCALPARPGCLNFVPARRPILRSLQTSALVVSKMPAATCAETQRPLRVLMTVFLPCRPGAQYIHYSCILLICITQTIGHHKRCVFTASALYVGNRNDGLDEEIQGSANTTS
jgi:hypothetical protein